MIARDADFIVQQFRALLSAATDCLDRFRGDPLAHDERIRAREIIGDLNSWALRVQVTRSGQDSKAGLEIPENIGSAGFELARIGRRLPHYERERLALVSARQAEHSNAQPLGEIPPLDTRSPLWVRSKYAADILHVDTESLANYRFEGTKSDDGLCGRDKYGRAWRKGGSNAHVWYLRSSMTLGSK